MSVNSTVFSSATPGGLIACLKVVEHLLTLEVPGTKSHGRFFYPLPVPVVGFPLTLCGGDGTLQQALDQAQAAVPKVPWIYEARTKWLNMCIGYWENYVFSHEALTSSKLHAQLISEDPEQSPGGVPLGVFAKYAGLAFLGERWLTVDDRVLRLFKGVRTRVYLRTTYNYEEGAFWSKLMARRIVARCERSHGGVPFGDRWDLLHRLKNCEISPDLIDLPAWAK